MYTNANIYSEGRSVLNHLCYTFKYSVVAKNAEVQKKTCCILGSRKQPIDLC